MILRTAGVGKSSDDLQRDLDYLLQVWSAIKESADERPSPFLIYQESDVIIRAIRDYLRTDINEIWIDDEAVYQRAHEFMKRIMEHNLGKLKQYTESDPLFTRYQIESQIESAFSREVRLPSGGALVIDHTEALISIDINSARSTAGSDIEETARNTNLEAAEEIARQLRLRDLGGLIVIDFIDMMNNRNQREVENALKEHLKVDRARVQIGRISRFGLLEMSRQRLRPSLGDSSHFTCPRCDGTGHIRSIQSMALSVLRLIEEEALKEMTGKVVVQVPVDAATFILNEKREAITSIESDNKIEVLIVPNPSMETPHYEIIRVRESDAGNRENSRPSYKQVKIDETEVIDIITDKSPARREEPAVKKVEPVENSRAASSNSSASGKGLIARLFGSFFGVPEEKKATESGQKRQGNRRRSSSDGSRNNRSSDNRSRRNNSNRQRNNKRRTSANDDKDNNNRQQTDENKSRSDGRKRGGRRGNNRSGNNRNRNRNRNTGNNREEENNRQDKQLDSNTDTSNRQSSRNQQERNSSQKADKQKHATDKVTEQQSVEQNSTRNQTENRDKETKASKGDNDVTQINPSNVNRPSGDTTKAAVHSDQQAKVDKSTTSEVAKTSEKAEKKTEKQEVIPHYSRTTGSMETSEEAES